MKVLEVRSAILVLLYGAYEEHGGKGCLQDRDIESCIPGAKPGVVEDLLVRLKDEGLAENGETMGTCTKWRLTTYGVELVETDPDEAADMRDVKQFIITGGNFQNLQVGDHNTQNVSYRSALRNLVTELSSVTTLDAAECAALRKALLLVLQNDKLTELLNKSPTLEG